MVTPTRPSVQTVPADAPLKQILSILHEDGVIVLSDFVSCVVIPQSEAYSRRPKKRSMRSMLRRSHSSGDKRTKDSWATRSRASERATRPYSTI